MGPPGALEGATVPQWRGMHDSGVPWTPLGEGASWAARRLVDLGNGRWEFRPTLGTWIGWTLYLAPAPIMSVLALAERNWKTLFAAALVWFLAASFLLLAPDFGVRVVFDCRSRRLWRTRSVTGEKGLRSAGFDEVRALQLFALQLTREAPQRAYELNAVLANDARVHLVNHTDLHVIQADATQLARLLSVPVWDVCMKDPSGTGPD